MFNEDLGLWAYLLTLLMFTYSKKSACKTWLSLAEGWLG